MQIQLNAQAYSVQEGSTIESLLNALKLDTGKIAIEVNLTIVPRSLYKETPLNDGDTVEIVRFIGGG